jgi:hypothetical protein
MRLSSRAGRSIPNLVGFALLALTSAGCGHGGEVKKRFMNEYECNDVVVKQISSSTYVASGCRAQATYTCAGRYNSLCVREYTDRDIRQINQPAPVVVAAHAGSGGPGRVERVFDEQRKLHVVKVSFKVYGGADLTFLGAPEHELTTVFVKASLRGKHPNCEALRIRVNDEPFDGLDVQAAWDDKNWATQASGRFQFESFKALARRYATFGVDLCGRRVQFGEGQVENLTKFLEIFSQIAMDVQDQQRAKPAAAEGGVTL